MIECRWNDPKNAHKGKLVYCKVDTLKTCVKNKIYEIESSCNYTLKLKGIKRVLGHWNFELLENNPALYRDFKIGLILDTNQIMETIPERKIDVTKNKEKALAQLFISRLTVNIQNNDSTMFDDVVSLVIKTHKKVWGIEQKDFEFLRQLSLQDVLKTLE